MSYNDTLNDLYNLQWHGINPGLDRINRLLSALDHPQKRFPSIHIGGTNGKGSTAAMVASILRQAGYRVGLYTSPHLIDFSERMTVNGVPISPKEIVARAQQVKEESDLLLEPMTFFEFTTAMAFCYFADAKIDIGVIEVGLGGRFDATNVLTPQVTAITQIDLDHERYLGPTVLAIAKEKAGIIKEGVPVITGAIQPEVLAHFEAIARSKNAPLIRLGYEIAVTGEGPEAMRYENGGRTMRVCCPLPGRHQMRNTAVAIGIIEQLSAFPVSEQDILDGIRHVEWPGRLQTIQDRPRILLDGAHNPAGTQVLADFLMEVDPDRRGKHWLIVGVMRDKNIRELLAPLTAWPDEIVLTRPNIERAAETDQLLASLEQPLSTTVQPRVSDAIDYVKSKMGPEDTLVITGSLYTVGEALAHFKGVAVSPLRG